MWKGRRYKEFERKKEQNEAEHEESAIDGMHVLAILLGSVDSVLYPVFTPDYKQRTAFVALPLRSSYSRHTLHVIESREQLPIRFDPDRNHIAKWIHSNRFEIDLTGTDLSVETTNSVQSGLNPDQNRITSLV